MKDLLITFYGDDFTGSTDTMEQLVLGGVPAVLFLDIPTQEQLDQFPDVRGIGIAGVSRTMSPAQMDEELPPKFEALKALGAPVFHYKICSTFDSSPTVGSIGYATDIGWKVFDPPIVPLVVGAPFLRRYVAFSNLFARVGDVTYRLDRHPTMSKHPITPMKEADLRVHLAEQTDRKIDALNIWHMERSDTEIAEYFQGLIDNSVEIVVMDAIDSNHLHITGRLIWAQTGEKPVFIVGSSGVELALALHWQHSGMVDKPTPIESPGEVDQLVVMSGSASPGNAAQIDYALNEGFHGMRLNTVRLVNPDTANAEREATIQAALEIINKGQSVLLYSAHGPDDPAIAETKAEMERVGLDPKTIGHQLGSQQGQILKAILQKSGLKRACVAGGDTCGYASLQMGIFALQVLMPIAPGAPLCVASSNDQQFDGLQISLKGGQNGKDDYFVAIQKGRALS